MHKKLFTAFPVVIFTILSTLSCSRNDNEFSTVEDTQNEVVISNELSNKRTTAIAEDSQGHIWIGTFRGLNRHDVHEIHQYFCTDDKSSICDNQINDIFLDSKGKLWISTIGGVCIYTDRDCFERIDIKDQEKNIYQILESSDGRYFFNTNSSILEYFPADGRIETRLQNIAPSPTFKFQKSKCLLDKSNRLWVICNDCLQCYETVTFTQVETIPTDGEITASYFDSAQNKLWIACSDKISQFDLLTTRFKPLPINITSRSGSEKTSINIISPYGTSSLLLNSFEHGLMLFNTVSGELLSNEDNGFPFDAPEYGLSHIFTDSHNNIWLGSYDQGTIVKYDAPSRFNNDKYLQRPLKDKSVMAVATDNDGNLWISTMVSGLYFYNPKTHNIRHPEIPAAIFSNASMSGVSSMAIDEDGNLWLGSLFAGKVVKCRNLGQGNLGVLKIFDIPGAHMMKADDWGRLWIGTTNKSIVCIDIKTNETKKVTIEQNEHSFISGILPLDKDHVVAIARRNLPLLVDAANMKITPMNIRGWDECFKRSFFIPTDIYKDSFGQIWIGTVGNGLLRYSPENETVTIVEGIPCNDIAAIREDHQGNIWVSTQYGLCKYDRTSGRFAPFYESDGTGGNQFYDRSACVLEDGTMVFGGTHGLTTFNPVNVALKRQVPLLFEDLKIHNKVVRPKDNPNIIDKMLSLTPNVTLNHTQNGFSISFAALDYAGQEQPRYLFKLDGHDNYWIKSEASHESHYANLRPGKYTFRVKTTGNNESLLE
ncbi:MAG: hybrid sensor histidine kinase/response regulator, partial [Bacteroidales bacterium]|nr:hybrid sensor histidine kinase/response regulator [Bacteroidales bacterium]